MTDLAREFAVLVDTLPMEHAHLVPESGLASLVTQTEYKANAVLGQYMWPQAAELLRLVLVRRSTIAAALRLAAIVAEPSEHLERLDTTIARAMSHRSGSEYGMAASMCADLRTMSEAAE
jgi:hypothetical protein